MESLAMGSEISILVGFLRACENALVEMAAKSLKSLSQRSPKYVRQTRKDLTRRSTASEYALPRPQTTAAAIIQFAAVPCNRTPIKRDYRLTDLLDVLSVLFRKPARASWPRFVMLVIGGTKFSAHPFRRDTELSKTQINKDRFQPDHHPFRRCEQQRQNLRDCSPWLFLGRSRQFHRE